MCTPSVILEVGSNNVVSNSENIEYLNGGSKGVNIPFWKLTLCKYKHCKNQEPVGLMLTLQGRDCLRDDM